MEDAGEVGMLSNILITYMVCGVLTAYLIWISAELEEETFIGLAFIFITWPLFFAKYAYKFLWFAIQSIAGSIKGMSLGTGGLHAAWKLLSK
jgi:hypothetical protein